MSTTETKNEAKPEKKDEDPAAAAFAERAHRKREHRVNLVSLMLAGGAVLISMVSLSREGFRGRDSSAQTLIHDQYELCRVLDQLRLEHPEISHMLALPAIASAQERRTEVVWRTYHRARQQVASMFDPIAAERTGARNQLYLEENSIALHVFDIYEQTVFQRQLARNGDNPERTAVLDSLVDYYEQRMLRNPRLRFHWDNGGSDMMERSTRARYNARVRHRYDATDYTDGHTPIDPEEAIVRRLSDPIVQSRDR